MRQATVTSPELQASFSHHYSRDGRVLGGVQCQLYMGQYAVARGLGLTEGEAEAAAWAEYNAPLECVGILPE